MSSLPDIFSAVVQGLGITLQVLILSIICASIIAFVAGLSRVNTNPLVRGFTGFYVEIFRGTSLIVQLFWFSYALPGLFNIHLGSDVWVAVLAISLNYGAYMSEIVRGSIQAVAAGQTEASIALNLSKFQRMRHIILPQALRMMLPEYGNYLIQILKATSLVSLIGLTDLLYYGNIYRSTHLSESPLVYVLLLVMYFIIALPLIFFTRKMEIVSKKGVAS
ncbi:ectoine/hydroxyectoine ABC transporter permease subunit EhuC [Sporosarcina sp. P37]|uniref:ectoine/hydroxyectoine ABC transporter permease subunit EhuC n=1 Tax=unclassified Sporosarcina TaxID=2647733 RepID=UPI000A17CADB|nr:MULTISPECIES: ectoine/hydroxyectoine ABC transporter permease subunit EhuC [unclassified Sporosarcina]ARK24151.1 ectoine/hydroxyectoine ABC transporter permease subunit EhuC [Sporosarcina sp. P37]PID17430.1 ectoine/hydroxyectoine ABC transporter permease subunit EhuC [Sporosarcina sp. P35]